MHLSLDEETPQETIDRLTRELDAVTQQSRVSHRMAIYWRGEYDRTEKKRARMEKSLNTWREKLLQQPKGERITESTLDLWTAEGEPTDTPSESQY